MDPILVRDGCIYVSLEAISEYDDQDYVLVVPKFATIPEQSRFCVLQATLPSLDMYGAYALTETEDDESGFILAEYAHSFYEADGADDVRFIVTHLR